VKWIVRVYSFVLLAYTGWRTFDFIQMQLPSSDLAFWLSIAFLFSSEAGLLIWHEISLRHVTTNEQEAIAVGLTWVDFVASLAAGVADMILRQTLVADYVVPPALAQFILYGLPLIMAMNVAGVLLFQSNDSEVQLDRARRQADYEIHRQAIRDLTKDRGVIAEEMKRSIYDDLRGEITGRTSRRYKRAGSSTSKPGGAGQQLPVFAKDVPVSAPTLPVISEDVPLITGNVPEDLPVINGNGSNPTRRQRTKAG